MKEGRLLGKGLPAGPGAACGRIALTAERAVAMAAKGEPVVLVREETSPEDIAGMHAAAGILTTRGGATSHAAVVARGMGKTCIVGAGEITVDHVAQGDSLRRLEGRRGRLAVDRRHDRGGDARQARRRSPRRSCRSRSRARSSRRIRPSTARSRASSSGPTSGAASASAPTPTRRTTRASPGSSAPRGSASAARSTCSSRRSASSTVREMILAETLEERRAALAKILPMQREDFLGHLPRDGRAAGDDPPARSAAARVPAARRRDDAEDRRPSSASRSRRSASGPTR